MYCGNNKSSRSIKRPYIFIPDGKFLRNFYGLRGRIYMGNSLKETIKSKQSADEKWNIATESSRKIPNTRNVRK